MIFLCEFWPRIFTARCNCQGNEQFREVKKTRETRRVRVRPRSLVKHSWRVEKRLSHSWRVADEYDVKKSRGQGACWYRLDAIFFFKRKYKTQATIKEMPRDCHFFLFRSEAYREELNVHEELLLFTLAVDEGEFAETDREVRRREDVEPPYVRSYLNKTRTLSVEWLTIPFLQGGNKDRNQHDQREKEWCAKIWTWVKKKSQKIKKSSKIHLAPVLVRVFWGRFVPDLTRSAVRVRGPGLNWTSGPTRSGRDQHQTRSRTRHRNLTRLVSYVLLTSLLFFSFLS